MDAAARIPSDLHPFDRKALIARPAGKAEKLFGEASNFATAFTAEEKRRIKKSKTFLVHNPHNLRKSRNHQPF